MLAAAFVGSALAAAGVVFQALLRNPLATPFTLGVSAGAALGAMLAITFSGALVGRSGRQRAGCELRRLAWPPSPSSTRWRARGTAAFRPTCMLLAGVTMNSFFSAVILFVQYLADMSQATRALRWLMGDLDVAGYTPILAALPLGVAAFAVFAWLPRALNLLALGADQAEARGVDVAPGAAARVLQRLARDRRCGVARRSRRLHRHRRAAPGAAAGRRDHRVVLPASALFGAAFLVGCDLVARTVMAPIELPVGIVTAMIGGPFFLWLLIRRA